MGSEQLRFLSAQILNFTVSKYEFPIGVVRPETLLSELPSTQHLQTNLAAPLDQTDQVGGLIAVSR